MLKNMAISVVGYVLLYTTIYSNKIKFFGAGLSHTPVHGRKQPPYVMPSSRPHTLRLLLPHFQISEWKLNIDEIMQRFERRHAKPRFALLRICRGKMCKILFIWSTEKERVGQDTMMWCCWGRISFISRKACLIIVCVVNHAFAVSGVYSTPAGDAFQSRCDYL